MKNKKICILGLGYIGLPTAALLACEGYNVHGVDIVQETVNIINDGKIHIVEPQLDSYVKKAVKQGNLIAHTMPLKADIYIIAVPTPLKENNTADLSYIMNAINSIIPYLSAKSTIILESTSPVGTTQKIKEYLTDNNIDTKEIFLAYCPERVLPGNIINELIHNDRIIGGVTPESSKIVQEFYSTFIKGNIYITDAKTAELAKLSENTFRDVNIAFANELSMICDKLDINTHELISLTNKHPRVNILTPGVGVGGHCIAVDPWFIVNNAFEESKIIRTAREVNLFKTEWIVEKINNIILEFKFKNNKEPSISCLGLTYKANIDDLRESPSLKIVKKLINKGFQIHAVEPNIEYIEGINLISLQEALHTDLVILLVAHDEFKQLKSNTKIIDFCGLITQKEDNNDNMC